MRASCAAPVQRGCLRDGLGRALADAPTPSVPSAGKPSHFCRRPFLMGRWTRSGEIWHSEVPRRPYPLPLGRGVASVPSVPSGIRSHVAFISVRAFNDKDTVSPAPRRGPARPRRTS